MRVVYWSAAILLVLVVGVLGLQRVASERVEVVELHTTDERGAMITTRLWVVDDGGYQYLRVGANGSGWFTRLQANETFELTRQGRTATYRALLRPGKGARINELMQAKYTWGDSLIGVLASSREGAIPIELQPL